MTTTTTARFVNFYDVLQVSSTASAAELRSAITTQRRVWVKRQASPDPARRAEAETRVRDIDAAEKTLLDTGARARFDAQLADYRPPVAETPAVAGDAAWIDRARAYLDADNPSAANYAAREALNQRSSDDEAWYIRAHSSFMLGNWRDAEYEFAEAIRLQPANAWYHYGLGEVYATQTKWRSALSEFEQAVKIEPANPVYRTSIAQVYLANDKAGEAVRIMEAVVKEHPGNAVFGYYLAIALHDSMLDSLGKVRPGVAPNAGRYVIVSEQQVQLVQRTISRIKTMKIADPDIKGLVGDMERMVREATAIRWDLQGIGGWLGAFFLLGFLPFVIGVGGAGPGPALFGLFVGGGIAWGCVASKRRPAWRHVRANMPLENRGI